MNGPQETQSTAKNEAYGPCLCREVLNTVRECLGVSPAVRQHFSNSRVEFLKAIREMLNERIEHISGQGQRGTRVAVE